MTEQASAGSADAGVPAADTYRAGAAAGARDGGLSRRWAIVLVLLAMALLWVLGWATMADKSLSVDEIATLRYVRQPARGLAQTMLREQANMGLYYLAMAPWVRVLDTETWLRLPSLVAAVATVPALFVLGRRLVGDAAAVVAIFLFASAALVVEHAQTARAYSAATLAVVVATWLFVRALEQPDRRRLALYALAVAIATYLHFVALLIVAAHLAALLATGRSAPWRPMLAAFAAIGSLCLPLFAILLWQDSGQIDWIPAMTPEWMASVLVSAAGGTTAITVFLAVGVAGGLLAWGRDPNPPMTLVAAWVLLPFAALVAVSLVKPLLIARYLLPFLPGVALLAGVGLVRFPKVRPPVAAAVAAIGLVIGVAAVGAWYQRPTPAWRELTAFMARVRGPHDIALYDQPAAWPPVEYYAARLEPPLTVPPRVDPDRLKEHTGRALWIVVFQLDPPERAELDRRIAVDWELVRSTGFDGVSLRRYLPRRGTP